MTMTLFSLTSSNRRPSRSSIRSYKTQSERKHEFRSISSPTPTEALQIIQQAPAPIENSNLINGYMVCGLAKSPEDWTLSTQPASSKAYRAHGSIGPAVQPTVLGSIPAQDRDVQTAQMFSQAAQAAFPNDAEITVMVNPPPSTCHSFVLQMNDNQQSVYGVALRLWVRADFDRATKVLEHIAPKEASRNLEHTTLWMPYCLAYLSHYPLFDLMSDYLRCTWMLFGKNTEKFNSDGVLRMTRLPPPQPNQLLQIHLEQHTFAYQMPAQSDGFQNFALWPFFSCLSPKHIIAVLEAALSPKGRVIFTSQHHTMLTLACETVRHYVRSWAGLYVPVVYGSHADDLIHEKAPYLLGLTRQSRAQLTVPKDALVADLDKHTIYTSKPPASLSPRQRKRYESMLCQALQHAETNGPPAHLRTAYEQNSQFSASGSMVTATSTPKAIDQPEWWSAAKVAVAINHVCRRVRQNYKLLSALDTVRRQSLKVNAHDLITIVHQRNNLARNNADAWANYINLKKRTDAKVSALQERESALEATVADGKRELTELSECAEQLIVDTRNLQLSLIQKKKENVHITFELRNKTIHARQLSSHIAELNNELRDANITLAMQQELLEEVERSRDTARAFEHRFEAVSQERDEAHRAVIHLTSLISGQIAYIERVLGTVVSPTSRPSSRADNRAILRRSHIMPGGHPKSASHSRWSSLDLALINTNVVAPFAEKTSPGRSSSPLSHIESMDDEPTLRDKVGAITSTVRKINQQCLAAIQELAERRNELDAAMTADESPTRKEAIAEPQPERKLIPSGLITKRSRQLNDETSSEVSKSTRSTNLSKMSSVPDLESVASARSDSAASYYRVDTPHVVEEDTVRIQAIEEVNEDDEEEDYVVELPDVHSKSHDEPQFLSQSNAIMV